MKSSRAKIVVVGSLNLDLVAAVERLPRPGETIAAAGLVSCRGGKGANQAIAAARQGADVSLIGCVGDDEAGREYRDFLRGEGVGLGGLRTLPREGTGTALIAVDASGENQIVLAAGANARLSAAMIRGCARSIRDAQAVLLQFESPLAAVHEAIRLAARADVRVVLNPSPGRSDFPWGELPLSTIVVNEREAAALFGIRADRLSQSMGRIQRRLASLAAGEVVITRGGESTLCVRGDCFFEVPVLSVRPVDTVGAGDAFAGALAVRLAEGESLGNAVRFANCAGALATLARGAQTSSPTRRATQYAAAHEVFHELTN